MVSVVVLWPPVHVADLWPVVAAAPLMESVLISVSWAAAVHRSCCLGGGPCVLLESGSSAPRLIIRDLDLLSSNTLHLQEHGHISLLWTFQPSSFLIFVFASTSIAAIRHVCQFWACFLELPSSSRSGRSFLSARTWPRTQGMNPKPSCRHGSIVLHQIFRICPFVQQKVGNLSR